MSQKNKTKTNGKLYDLYDDSISISGEMNLSAYIHEISKCVKALISKDAGQTTKTAGVPQQCTRAILNNLIKKAGITQAELCQNIEYTPSTVSLALKRMAYDGLLEMSINPQDKRQTFISITKKGLETSRYLENTSGEIDEILIKGFTEEERNLIPSFLKRMLMNISETQNEQALKENGTASKVKANTANKKRDKEKTSADKKKK